MNRRTSADSTDTHCVYRTSPALADEGRSRGAAPVALVGRCGKAANGEQRPHQWLRQVMQHIAGLLRCTCCLRQPVRFVGALSRPRRVEQGILSISACQPQALADPKLRLQGLRAQTLR